MKLNAVDWAALVLVIIGGINWGLLGLFKFDLVAEIFGEMSGLTRFIYTLVGLSAIYVLFMLTRLTNDTTRHDLR